MEEIVSVAKPWLEQNQKPMVEIRNITKNFGDFTAVNNINLEIYQGELFCLLGGSGCGKSTLLRMLAGFETPSAGQILIDGQDMAGIASYNRPTNMMFQSYALFPHMSVQKNILYGLKQEGMDKTEAETRVADMLKLVKLEKLANRRPHQLSGGQRQRVALARALVKQPKLLLLDEPLGALDKKLREDTQFELIRIQETLGVTFIVVTHDQEEAMTLATRVAVMNEGEIVQLGEPREMYEFPKTRFVAEFLGNMNMFQGKVSGANADVATISSDELGDLTIRNTANLANNTEVSLAVRPEKVEISAKALDNLAISLKGTVEEIAYLGSQSTYVIRLDNGKIIKAMRANRVRNHEDNITWGDKVHIGWHDNSAVVLTS